MELVIDTHTHTLASGHAYSTIIENAAASKHKGLALLCTTDHAPSMPGAPHQWFFSNSRILPRFINDVGILRGCESNILNQDGEIDLSEVTTSYLDWVIGSFHEPIFPPSSKQEHTQALLNVIKSGRVDALGHLGNPRYAFDIQSVLLCAKEYNVAIEVNNTSLTGIARVGSDIICDKIIEAGKEIGVYFTTGSDAHFCDDIAKFDHVIPLLEKHQIPEDKIITTSTSRFLNFLQLRGRQAIPEFEHLY